MKKIIKIHTDFIKLGQLLKMINEIGNGAEAKIYLEEIEVLVNEEHETRRGRKIYPGYTLKIREEEFFIEREINDWKTRIV